jgi:hypothetical protein
LNELLELVLFTANLGVTCILNWGLEGLNAEVKYNGDFKLRPRKGSTLKLNTKED